MPSQWEQRQVIPEEPTGRRDNLLKISGSFREIEMAALSCVPYGFKNVFSFKVLNH